MSLPHRPAVSQRVRTQDWTAPVLLAASLLAHGLALTLLFRTPQAAAARPPAEIPIEVVREVPVSESAAKAVPSIAKSPPTPDAPRRPEHSGSKTLGTVAKSANPPHPAATPAASKDAASHRPATSAQPSVAERMQHLLGPMPAAVMPALASASDSSFDDSVSYRQMIMSKIARQRREDRHNGIPGHVVVTFTIGDNGEVLSCAVREKSVDPVLDAEAVAMVHRGEPYPPPPLGALRAFSFGLAFRPS